MQTLTRTNIHSQVPNFLLKKLDNFLTQSFVNSLEIILVCLHEKLIVSAKDKVHSLIFLILHAATLNNKIVLH